MHLLHLASIPECILLHLASYFLEPVHCALLTELSMDPHATRDLIAALTMNIHQLTLGQQSLQQTAMQTTTQQQQQQQHLVHTLASSQRSNGCMGLDQVAQGLKPPLFTGERNSVELDTWLFQAHEYFQTISLESDEQRVRAAGLMLGGQAASWYRDVMRREPNAIRMWEHFEDSISRMFMPIGREKQARQKLDSAYQRKGDSVADYTTYFRRVVLAIGPGVSEEERLFRYVKGLQDPIQKEVYMREPSSFDEASHIAVRYESLSHAFRANIGPTFFPSTNTDSSGPTPMELGSMRSENMRCFYCGNLGHKIVRCQQRMADEGAGDNVPSA